MITLTTQEILVSGAGMEDTNGLFRRAEDFLGNVQWKHEWARRSRRVHWRPSVATLTRLPARTHAPGSNLGNCLKTDRVGRPVRNSTLLLQYCTVLLKTVLCGCTVIS